ncbi:Aste57867_5045 [Aphanomyces stellatus]|uniref:Aste57867_5045 protein n=1 Tax=Aphanomyces stellatus TaxID=120398 RepID=A0A485KH29_9STRA|nr:hypothetical protein As57867_005032 [Aphanomyces stellatus]VFT82126.1 Aste57867_5045 [Aphanomyces stellatus]
MLVAQDIVMGEDPLHSIDYKEDTIESPPNSRRRRFFKSGLSTYEEFYSRNETGRRLGRYTLHVKLNSERPTMTLLLSNNNPIDPLSLLDDDDDLAPSTPRLRAASESGTSDTLESNQDNDLKLRSSSFDIPARPSALPEVLRPKAIATERFSFFRHRSLPKMQYDETRSTEPVVVKDEPTMSPPGEARPSFPMLPTPDDEDTDAFPVIQDSFDGASSPSEDENATNTSPVSAAAAAADARFAPRDSSFSVDPNYKPVAIRNSVSNNMNVVSFISGYKGTKQNSRGSFRASLDSRPSLDSVRKSARKSKHSPSSYNPQELSLNKKLREARNRIPLEFRDELSHLLEKPFVPTAKTKAKQVKFAAENDVRVFEWEEEDDDDTKNRIEESADDVVLMTDGVLDDKVYIVELDGQAVNV